MTRIFDDPATFMDDMVQGFCDLYPQYVSHVHGGVVRAQQTRSGKVAVIVGGGSGHYPAFCGVVGPGFADGAVIGNVFTSPSAQDAINVGAAADNGGGVVITSGNYAGDVLHFTEAADALTRAGIESRTVFVTDDIASAPVGEEDKRRGIAGDFVVFKVMSAAAEEGYSLDEVVRVGQKANDLTRTLGVAFSGCTLPGAGEPLFTVPDGKMGLGLGIHGEPGVSEDDIPSARELARQLVDSVLAECDTSHNKKVGVILNGLGATKYEELFVLWRSVRQFLLDQGLTIVDPEVGELVTSLDMAGLSLTLVVLDDELERLWKAPANTPAYKKGEALAVRAADAQREFRRIDFGHEARTFGEVSEKSREYAARVRSMLASVSDALESAEKELGRIDAVAGDGDHGRGMVKGVHAALDAMTSAIDRGAGLEEALTSAGEAWASKAGGTSGALWGAWFRAVGADLGDPATGLDAIAISRALSAGSTAVMNVGKAKPGDKTMVDSMVPFVETLEDALASGQTLAQAWAEAAGSATKAAEDTAQLSPKIGRARPLAERSIGTPDAGAVSLALMFTAVTPHLND
jgi:dihydroxyacetone kinase